MKLHANMKIGAMNNPQNKLEEEIEFIAENFDFLDLTLEPEVTYPDKINIKKVLELKNRYKLKIIGHTPWNLPIASSFSSVRKAGYEEFLKCLNVFSKLGVNLVNVHPVIPQDNPDPNLIIKYNLDFLKKVVKKAKKHNIKIMLENTKAIFNELEVLGTLLDEIPSLKLHWDVGHANLGNEGEKKTKLAFHNFKSKIAHLHFSDNNGSEDQHLPLGTGNISWQFIIDILKEYKYNKTITLEIHSPDISYLLFSRDKLKLLLQ